MIHCEVDLLLPGTVLDSTEELMNHFDYYKIVINKRQDPDLEISQPPYIKKIFFQKKL